MKTTHAVEVESRAPIPILYADRRDPLTLAIATDAQTPAIDALRQKAYAAAGYFTLPDPRTVLRSTDLPHAICLVVASKREVAATVRLTYARQRAEAERILEGTADVPADYFPTLALCRGATDPRFRGLGLMAFLVSLGVAIGRRAGLGSALGVQYDGTPHYRAMNAAGWNRRPIVDRMFTVKGQAGLGLVYIGRDRFEFSVRHSEREHAALHRQFQVEPVITAAALQLDKLR